MTKIKELATVVIALHLALVVSCVPVRAQGPDQPSPEAPSFSLLGEQLSHDFKYLVDNFQMDAVDIVTSPLHAFDQNSVLRSPTFYLALAGVGAAFGGSFALDQTMRARLRSMNPNTASDLQDLSYGAIGAASGLTYAWGLYSDDAQVRDRMMTGGEGAVIATLLAEYALKPAFGRLRPYQRNHSHTSFFDGGDSFPSAEVTPMFALAAGISESFDNRWYVALPAYSLALTDGIGRMGADKHWFSDVVGGALLGWGTSELLIHLHRLHSDELTRWRIFPASSPSNRQNETPMGLGVSYSW